MKTLKWNGLNIHIGDWIWIGEKDGFGGIAKIKNIKFRKLWKENDGKYILILNNSKVNGGDWYLYKKDIKEEIFMIAKTKGELLAQLTAKIL